MNSLFYELIADKQIKRFIKILEILEKQKEAITFEEVREIVAVTMATLKNDLEKIQERIPASIIIKTTKEFISLEATSTEIQNCIFDIAQNTLSYQILRYSFNQPEISLEELSEKLLSSTSTLKNRIQHMNPILERYHCRLSSYTTTMRGEEVNIRCFYRAYFSEFRDLFISKETEQRQDYYQVFDAIRQEMLSRKCKMLNSSYFQVIQWLLITQERMEANHHIKLDPIFVDNIKKISMYQEYKIAYTKVITQEELCEDDIVWSYIGELDAVVYTLEKSNLSRCRSGPISKSYQTIIDSVIKQVAVQLSIDQKNIVNFIKLHQCFFINLYLISQLSATFQMVSQDLKQHVKQHLTPIYQAWYDMLDSNRGFSFLEYHQDVCCKLAMISSQFTYHKPSKVKRVLFSFTGETGLSSYLEAKARMLFSKEVECIFAFKQPLSNEIIESINPEIVVSNYNNIENITFDNIIRMAYIPSEYDWNRLSTYILKIE